MNSHCIFPLQVPPHLQQPYNYPPATQHTPQQPFIHGRHSIGSRPTSSAEQSPYYPYSSAANRSVFKGVVFSNI